jgi:hypothetical protein
MINQLIILGASLLAYSAHIFSVDVINGNGSGTSFNFDISGHAFYPFQGRFFTGALTSGGKEFSIAGVNRAENKFKALAPEKITLNGVVNQHNPLYNSGIGNIAIFGNRIIVTGAGNKGSLYLVDDIRSTIEVTGITGIADATGATASRIIALATQSVQNEESAELENGIAAFLATANSNGNFNGSGAGIAYVGLTNKKIENREILSWQPFDAQAGKPGNRAAQINQDTAAVSITSPVTSIGSIVDMHWDRQLARLYIALQVQSGAGATDGARALLVGSVVNGQVVFQAIAPDTVFTDNQKIVGTRGALSQVSLFKVRTLQTSTYLKYLVVVGSSADISQAQQKVYAMPLVDSPGSLAQGTLAQVTSLPLDQIVPAEPFRFQARRFVRAAVTPADAFSIDSIPAQVGGGTVLPGPITDIVAYKDAVFVSVSQANNNQQAGIFFSQALFDSAGRINGWTEWQRAASVIPAAGFALDFYNGNFFIMPQTAPDTARSVLRTNWTTGETQAEKFIAQEFTQAAAGVLGLFDFPYNTQAFSTQIGSRLSLNIFTGFGKILILQTGIDTQNTFGPNTQTTPLFISKDGSLAGFSQAFGLNISGGVLAQLGLITSCEIVSDGTQNWLVVGGARGIAVLANPDGSGWLQNPGLASSFQGLSNSMRFVKIGNFSQVKKLTSIGNKLFILSPAKLERIEINTSLTSSVTVLAQSTDFGFAQGTLSDVIISGPLAVLGTSSGLFRSGNNVNITTASNPLSASWVSVQIPESVGFLNNIAPIVKLYAISPTGFEKDVFMPSSGVMNSGNAGNIYVLNGYVGYHQSQVYRFALNNNNSSVSDQSIGLFPDIYTGFLRTFFFPFNTYRNGIATDGALFFATRNAYNGSRPFLSILSPLLRSGLVERNIATQEVPLQISGAHMIGRLIRSSATGYWLINGDFGLRTNQ